MGHLVDDVRTWWHDPNNSQERELLRQVLLSKDLSIKSLPNSSF